MASTPGQKGCYALSLLLVFYVVGCLVFVRLERKAELQTYAANKQMYEDMRDLYSFEYCADPAFQRLTFCQNQAEFSTALKDYFNKHGNAMEDREQWTFLGSTFFLTHLATTIGYGTSHAQTPAGRLATIIFALVGIPILGYTLAQVARLDLKLAVIVMEHGLGAKMNTTRRHMLVLWVLLCVFLFGGAFVYHCLEPWTYLESLYFCFVTLSTVGFGDYLPSSNVSRIFSIFYMILGLGVCASIIAVLTGLVAESHEGVDSYVARKFRDGCGMDCTSRSRA